jgi:transcriptional regulator with XRE-family HTH domain
MTTVPFGTRLRSLRERAGMTLAELAKKVGTDQGTLSRWERNFIVPGLTTVEQLAIFVGVSTAELLTGESPKPPRSN